MKKLFKLYINWLIIWLGMFTILWWGYLLIKARQSSTSWVTVDSSNPASLYVNNNETLTSSKRNRLVQNSVREEVPTTDTGLFDTNCDRKWLREDHLFYAIDIKIDWSQLLFYNNNNQYYIDNILKSKTIWTGGPRTNSHVRKKCK